MKDKITVAIVCALFIGMAWISSASNTASSNKSLISEDAVLILSGDTTMDFIDYDVLETTLFDEAELQPEISAINTCTLESIDTDALSFGEAFEYYRQCIGTDSSFQWNGMEYTTLLVEEVIIQVADSVYVDSNTEGAEVSKTR